MNHMNSLGPSNQENYLTFDTLQKRYRGSTGTRFIPYTGHQYESSADDLSSLVFHELFDRMQLNTELHNMQMMHRYTSSARALHPTLHCIMHGDKTYPAYRKLETALVFEESEALQLLRDLNEFITDIHSHNIYHFDICQKNIMFEDVVGEGRRYTVVGYGKMRTRDTFAMSPLMGSTILAPVQILQEMMSSKVEPDEIPFGTFREKFINFYQRVATIISPMSFDILRVCENAVTGFIDSTLQRLCVIENDMVQKTAMKLDPAEVDRFTLALTLWRMFPFQQEVMNWVRRVLRTGTGEDTVVAPLGVTEKASTCQPALAPAPTPEPVGGNGGKKTYKYQGQERIVRMDENGRGFILFKGQRIFISVDT